MFGRKTAAILVAEFLGTAVLTSIALSVANSQLAIPYFIGAAVAFAAAVGVFTMGTTSGAHFNPAITISQWTIRKISTVMAIFYIIAQVLGAAAAMYLYKYLLDYKANSIAKPEFDWKVLIAELVGTAVFVFGVTAAVYQYQKNEKANWAATVGVSLFIGVVIASTVSFGLLNPAIALGMNPWSNSWNTAYIVGPLIGAIVGANIYSMLFAGENSLKDLASKASATKASSKKSKK